MDVIEVNFLAVLILIFILKIRRDFLCFIFLALFYFLFVAIPLFVILIGHDNSDYACIAIEKSYIFLMSFSLVYLLANLNERKNSASFYFNDSDELNFITKNSVYLVILGVLMKIAGGDLIHSSIYYIPWQFPILYGISDRVYYLGIMLTCMSIYRFGFNNRNNAVIIIVLILGILGGSRVTILIPLAFLFLLRSSLSQIKTVLVLSAFAVIVLFSLIVFIGLYRIDAGDREFGFDALLDIFVFRISEFMWPVALIEKLDSREIEFDFSWFVSGFLGVIPAFIGENIIGESVFARDTNLMLNSGIGNEYMSVPLTPIGEGYYWYGNLGVVLISFLYAIGFIFLYKLTSKLNKTTQTLLYLQLFRSAFALPVAGFPEYVSFLTKDILIDFLLVYIVINLFNLFRGRYMSPRLTAQTLNVDETKKDIPVADSGLSPSARASVNFSLN